MKSVDESSISYQPLLTISIPTFNRLDVLRLLVETLIHQATSAGVLGEKIEILISNNASTDGTAEYLNGLASIDGIRVIHHSENSGGDANILYCCQAARSKYVWVIGDDDVPLDGAIGAVLKCLERDKPDLLYLPALWLAGDLSERAKNKIGSDTVWALDSMGLAIRSSVYVTFISSWVLNLDSYRSYVQPPMLDRYRGTSFTQLEWTFTLLKEGSNFLCANDVWLLARGGCSGGYSLFEAFSNQYNRIVDEKLADSPQLHHFFRRCMLLCFIPSLVWNGRSNAAGDFDKFDKVVVANILKAAYEHIVFYQLIVVPIIKLDKPLAWIFRSASIIFAKLWLSWIRFGLYFKK